MSGPEALRAYTAAEVGQMWGASRQFICDQARAGKIPHFKVGREFRFTAEDVAAGLRNLKAAADAPRMVRAPRSRRRKKASAGPGVAPRPGPAEHNPAA